MFPFGHISIIICKFFEFGHFLHFVVWARLNLFLNKPWFSRVCSRGLCKTLWEKGEIARNEQFLLFPQCFIPFRRTYCPFHQIQNFIYLLSSLRLIDQYTICGILKTFKVLLAGQIFIKLLSYLQQQMSGIIYHKTLEMLNLYPVLNVISTSIDQFQQTVSTWRQKNPNYLHPTKKQLLFTKSTSFLQKYHRFPTFLLWKNRI